MGLNQVIISSFKKSFESKCFNLIIDAYNTSLNAKTIKLDWDENDITSELHSYIIDNPLRTRWHISSNVEEHQSKNNVKKKKGFAAKLPRIDLRMNKFILAKEYKYFFEAKRIKEKDSHLKRRYITDGIDSFTSKKYEKGSMLGYLIEGDLFSTIKGINSLLNKDKRKMETLRKKPFKTHNHYYESVHKEIGVLKHLIFDFTSS